jgi:spermidine synthase
MIKSERVYTSKYNGKLFIQMDGKHKLLDSATVNYSYGSVQRIWRSGLSKLNIYDLNNVLLLGLGGGSVVNILKEELGYEGKLTAVELDPVMMDIAAQEYGMKSSRKLKIVCADAAAFIENNKQKYDLIITDVFIGSKLPAFVKRKDFWIHLHHRLSDHGLAIVNWSLTSTNELALERLISREKSRFKVRVRRKVAGSNTLLFAEKLPGI